MPQSVDKSVERNTDIIVGLQMGIISMEGSFATSIKIPNAHNF